MRHGSWTFDIWEWVLFTTYQIYVLTFLFGPNNSRLCFLRMQIFFDWLPIALLPGPTHPRESDLPQRINVLNGSLITSHLSSGWPASFLPMCISYCSLQFYNHRFCTSVNTTGFDFEVRLWAAMSGSMSHFHYFYLKVNRCQLRFLKKPNRFRGLF